MTAPLITSEVHWYERDVFGSPNRYVRDPKLAEKLSWLLGTKTINERQMERLTELFGVRWVQVLAPSRV